MIATGSVVLDQQKQCRYRLSRYLDTGRHSLVYEAQWLAPTDGEAAETVVVKLGRLTPLERTDAATLEARLKDLEQLYTSELQTVRALRQHSGERFAPWAHAGQLVTAGSDTGASNEDQVETRLPVLVLQRIPDDWLLGPQVRPPNAAPDEALALLSGAQYAELLVLLHTRLGRACGDRKLKDLRWETQADGGRLYVLDWNVTEPLPTTPREAALPVVQRDIRLMGQLWFGLLLGQAPQDLAGQPIIAPPAGTAWATLSQGSRRLLRATVQSMQEQGFRAAEDLQQAWRAWSRHGQQTADELLRAANLLLIQEQAHTWDQVADLVDLARRKQARPADLQDLEAWLARREERLRQDTRFIQGTLEIGRYEKARTEADALRRREDLTAPQHLWASRWYLVAEALRELTSSNVVANTLLPGLQSLIESLNAGQLGPAQTAWDADATWLQKNGVQLQPDDRLVHIVLPQPDGPPKPLRALETLQRDLGLQQALAVAVAASDLATQVAAYRQTCGLLEALRAADPLHAQWVQGTLGFSLAGTLEDLQQREKARVQQQVERRQESQAADQALAAMQRALQAQPLAWPELRDILDPMDLDSPLRARLGALQRTLADGYGLALVEAARSELAALESLGYRDLARCTQRLLGGLFYAHLALRARARLWPDEVRQLQALSDQARRADLLGSDQQAQQTLADLLSRKAQLQLKAQQQFGAVADLLADPAPAGLIELLNTADGEQVELWERVKGREYLRSVEYLLVVHQLRQIKGRLAQQQTDIADLTSSYQALVTNKADAEKSLSASIVALRARLSELQAALPGLEASLAQTQQSAPEEAGLTGASSSPRAVPPLAEALSVTQVQDCFARLQEMENNDLPGNLAAYGQALLRLRAARNLTLDELSHLTAAESWYDRRNAIVSASSEEYVGLWNAVLQKASPAKPNPSQPASSTQLNQALEQALEATNELWQSTWELPPAYQEHLPRNLQSNLRSVYNCLRRPPLQVEPRLLVWLGLLEHYITHAAYGPARGDIQALVDAATRQLRDMRRGKPDAHAALAETLRMLAYSLEPGQLRATAERIASGPAVAPIPRRTALLRLMLGTLGVLGLLLGVGLLVGYWMQLRPQIKTLSDRLATLEASASGQTAAVDQEREDRIMATVEARLAARPPTPTRQPVLTLQIDIVPDALPADGVARASVQVRVQDADGRNAADGTEVLLSLSPENAGRLESSKPATQGGLAKTGLVAGTTPTEIKVIVRVGNSTQEKVINLIAAR